MEMEAASSSEGNVRPALPSRQAVVNAGGFVSLEHMTIIRNRLSLLTNRNDGIKAAMQTLRTKKAEQLFAHMQARRIVIDQLGQPNLETETRHFCLNALDVRRRHLHAREKELVFFWRSCSVNMMQSLILRSLHLWS